MGIDGISKIKKTTANIIPNQENPTKIAPTITEITTAIAALIPTNVRIQV